MLSGPRWRSALGVFLLVVALGGLAFAAGRALVLQTHRHVVVEVYNVNSIGQVFVNCHQASVVGRQKPGETVDLGWLQPDDRVFLSATSRDGSPTWGFTADSNGTAFFKGMRGHTNGLVPPAEPNAVVFAKGFTAAGDYLGQIGCQEPGVVALPSYIQSPDDAEVLEVNGVDPPYEPSHSPYDQIDAIGGCALTVLAVLGAIAALATGPMRRLLRSHWKLTGGVGGALGILAAISSFFGISVLLAILTVYGILLLLASAVLLILPAGTRPLECATGTRGAKAQEEDHAAADGHDAHLAADDR